MAARRKKDDGTISSRGEVSPPMSINEVEAQVDVDPEEEDADFDAVQAAGAVNAESVALNEQTKNVISSKRDRKRRIRWNDDNAQVVYDSIRQAGWNTASTYIMCRRVTGEPAQWSVACSAVANGDALYKWVAGTCHKQAAAHTYEIRVIDSHTSQERGRGKIFMPDTLAVTVDPQTQTQNPYTPFSVSYPQFTHPGGAVSNVHPPAGWYPGMPHSPPQAAPAAPPAPAPAAPAAPLPPPVVQSSGEVADLRAQVGYLSGQLSQLLTKVGLPATPPPPPQVTFVSPPTPPGSQRAEAQPAPQGAPPGLVHVPGFGYVNAELVASALMAQMRSTLGPPPPPPPRPAPPPPLDSVGLSGIRMPPSHEEPPSLTSMVQRSARDMRETASGLSAMLHAAEEIRDTFAPPAAEEKRDRDDAPIQKNGEPAKKPFEVLDAGPVRVPYDPETGDMKGFANLLMVNADKIGGFVGKLYEKAAVAAAQAAAVQNGKTFTPAPTLPNGTASSAWPPPAPLPRA